MAQGIIANRFGRQVAAGGIEAGDPTSDGCGCFCECAAPDDELSRGAGCNLCTTPRSFVATDSGILVPCQATCFAQVSGPFLGPNWYKWTVNSGIGDTRCLGGSGAPLWDGPGLSVTQRVYSDAACTTLVAGPDDFTPMWHLLRQAGAWRLTLTGNLGGGGGPHIVAFDATIGTSDPIDCCQSLHFTNEITACGTSTDPYLSGGAGAVAYLIGTGGECFLTPCCPL